MANHKKNNTLPAGKTYQQFSEDICRLLETARRSAGRAVNAILTASYWEIGRRIVEFEQQGEKRAEYGSSLVQQLSSDLTNKFGRGFSERNLRQMRLFYTLWQKPQTLSAEFINSEKWQTLSAKSEITNIAEYFPLSWSAYVRLMTVKDKNARQFYESETLRGGWSVRQLNRQISSQFYERTLLSRNKAAILNKGSVPEQNDITSPEEEIKDPYVLEFLGLKDEYSENDLEEALIRHLEIFLLELGSNFAFIARQKRLRIGNKWYRVDLVFFHRKLQCLVLIDLKIGEFSHADAGQMHLYCNYASEHWTNENENPPVGLILCAEKDHAVAKYALEGLPNKILASEYQLLLPNEKELVEELIKTRKILESR
ncbi:PDDEXK nuclease domain-containing protein [Desulfonema limicola]|nr:PDDEXK nuclease domain-containing protein [Desulfonema limicola]